jgi:hypothetical protein
MRAAEMVQRLTDFSALEDGIETIARASGASRALRLAGVLVMVTMLGATLAACGRCGDFLSSSLGQIGACHKDSSSPQQ